MKTKNNPGIKTTEFGSLLMVWIGAFLTFAVSIGWIPTDLAEEVRANLMEYSLAAATLASTGYQLFRSALKAYMHATGEDPEDAA